MVHSNKNIAPLPEEWDEASPIQPLSADEARRVREQNPPQSPWRVVLGQVVVAVVAGLLAWALTGKQNVGWSVAYGAMAVAIPAAVFARGLTGKFASVNAGAATVAFLVWEMVKVALSLAMLLAAPRLVAGLSWPAMLIGLALALQVYVVALAFPPKPAKKPS